MAEDKNMHEVESPYNEEVIEESNNKYDSLSEEEIEEVQDKAKQILDDLKKAYETGDPSSELAMDVAQAHKEWLNYTLSSYSKGLHRGLADTYIADKQVMKYYDDIAGEGAAHFFREAIYEFTNENE